jgi:transposase
MRAGGQADLEAIGILPQFAEISVHDGWGSYFVYDCEHAACIEHLLQDLVFLAEQGMQWAVDLKTLLLDMKEATDQAREQGKRWLDPLEVVDWEAQFLRLLDDQDQAHPRTTPPPGKRGQCKHNDARNLLDRLRKQQKAILTFLEDLRVDFDNNLAERSSHGQGAAKSPRLLPQRGFRSNLCSHSWLFVHASQTRPACAIPSD